MGYKKRLDRAFDGVPILQMCPGRKYVLFSDCHRGNGTNNDNFLKNQHLYMAALRYYAKNQYTYIELGDGDELWENRKMEQIGILDPTSAAKNYTTKQRAEKKLTEWAKENGRVLITGHTHRPMVTQDAYGYMNTGSCVHPYLITCIEVENDTLTLVKWYMDAGTNGNLFVERSLI